MIRERKIKRHIGERQRGEREREREREILKERGVVSEREPEGEEREIRE